MPYGCASSNLANRTTLKSFKLSFINSYISENIYEFLTPVGSVYTTSILPLVANKTTELSSDILEHLPETLSIGDYICISENSFKLKEDLDPKVNLSKYLISGKDIRGIDSLIEEVGVPRTVLFKASRFELPEDHKALHLIQQVRDEAHRFAITKHRAKRDKKRGGSVLEAIPGLGPKRRRDLLTHFGGIQGVLKASEKELMLVSGLGEVMARTIYKILHEAI